MILAATTFRQQLVERLDPLDKPEQAWPEHKPAAVLAPIVVLHERPHFLFLKRPQTMREHAGQIAFPGGRLDAGETFAEAAQREAYEELGLPQDQGLILGRIPGIPTITNYWVTPVVAWYDQPPALRPNASEVAEHFYAPVDVLLEPKIYEGRPVEWRGRPGWIDYFNYPSPGGQIKIIWGATGRILHQFLRQVFGWQPPDPRWAEYAAKITSAF